MATSSHSRWQIACSLRSGNGSLSLGPVSSCSWQQRVGYGHNFLLPNGACEGNFAGMPVIMS